MSETLREFIVAAKAVEDANHLWDVFLAFFRSRGARSISYRHLTVDPELEQTPQISHDGFPEAFVRAFESGDWARNNPVVELALSTTDPFYWSDISRMTELGPLDLEFIDLIREQLDGDGVAIQVFGPHGRHGTVNLGFPSDHPRMGRAELKELQAAAQVAHLAYCKMESNAEPTPGVSLTGRECEVLEWIARGKSNSVIADILDISVHTVDTHVRRIFRKLDVNDRTTAAVKGLGAGLVQTAA